MSNQYYNITYCVITDLWTTCTHWSKLCFPWILWAYAPTYANKKHTHTHPQFSVPLPSEPWFLIRELAAVLPAKIHTVIRLTLSTLWLMPHWSVCQNACEGKRERWIKKETDRETKKGSWRLGKCAFLVSWAALFNPIERTKEIFTFCLHCFHKRNAFWYSEFITAQINPRLACTLLVLVYVYGPACYTMYLVQRRLWLNAA